MKKKSNKELVKLYYTELWNNHDKKYIDILFDEEITFRGSLNVETIGKKGFEDYMDVVSQGIPNLFHGIEIMVAEEDYIAVRAIYNGTHTGKVFDYEATNNRIRYNGASFFKFKDGKIIDIWVLGDLASLHQQLQKND